MQIRRYRLAVISLLLFSVSRQAPGQRPDAASPGAKDTPFTQHRINEIAAACVTARMALSGLKGARKPLETPAQYRSRIHGYFAALDTLMKELQPVRQPPMPRNMEPDNLQCWRRIAAVVNRLPAEVADARVAWAAVPKQGDKARLGPKLLRALDTVQAILNGLRDARP